MPDSDTNPKEAAADLAPASERREQSERLLAELREASARSRQLTAYLEAVIDHVQKQLADAGEVAPPEIV